MTRQGLFSLAMRVIGVYFLVMICPYYLSMFFQQDTLSSITPFITASLTLALSLVLIFASGPIGRLLAGGKSEAVNLTALTCGDWQAILFSAIGVGTMVRGVQQLGLYLPGGRGISMERVVPAAFQIVLGVALFLGARGLANLWRMLRLSGTGARSEGQAGR
jgi:hypothetical protein